MTDEMFWELLDRYENKELSEKQVVETVYLLNNYNYQETVLDLELLLTGSKATAAKIYLKELARNKK